jgi:hypothetical protein
MTKLRRLATYLSAVALAAALAACGGSSGPPTGGSTPAPTPTPCTQSVFFEDSGSLPSSTLGFFDFSVPDSGRLDATLDWTDPASRIGFYVVPTNTCTLDEFNSRSCNFLVRSEPSSTKPTKISTPNFTAGAYRGMIANFADIDESISLQLVLSKGSCAAFAGGAPGAQAHAAQDLPALRRMIRR